ncbi:MAG TPA: PorV/PorQ family protein [Calditrichia bacterium]|nr:PorV/PorQ family protein [Calditrichota bacterium]HQU73234.1 PorV/PorQ family protein [Calditrichia bacterium]HQV31957.1 PorV/PorQ family protein [Calditrichia bacterium]
MKNLINLILLLGIFAAGAVLAQAENFREDLSKRGTTAAAFLEIGVGSRALAMGGAYTGVADGPSALYWNVAGIANMERNSVLFNHTEWIADTRFDFVGGVFPLGSLGTVGIGLTALTMDEMDVTTVSQPEGTGQRFRAGDYAVSLAYALRLTDRFAIGFNPKIIHQSIWDMSATTVAIDLGVHYKTPFDGITLGFSMTNFGGNMRMSGENNRVLYDLDPTSTGNNERLPALLEGDSWQLPLNFKIGLAYELLKNENNAILLALDAQHPNNDYESVQLGIEYQFGKFVALRAGHSSLFLKDTETSVTLGAGLNYPFLGNLMMHLDYAYADFGMLESIQKFSLGFDF